jgi:hypothetical protein
MNDSGGGFGMRTIYVSVVYMASVLVLLSFPLYSVSTCSGKILSGAIPPPQVSQISSTGPTISEWPDTSNTLYIDGAFTGQIEESFEYNARVNDTDGISTVLFRFKWENDGSWMNRTTIQSEGNETYGIFKGNLTWPAPGGGVFEFKVFANDTLGNWDETNPMTVRFGYIYYDPLYLPLTWVLVSIVLVALVSGAVWLRKGRT